MRPRLITKPSVKYGDSCYKYRIYEYIKEEQCLCIWPKKSMSVIKA